MKKYIIAFLLFVPFVAMAADHCTNPSEYTIDRRCYVTDEQKKTKPFNAVVGLVNASGTYCTGTIARWNRPGFNEDLYLFTAKHCSDRDNDGISDKVLHIKLQNGDKIDVTLFDTGKEINKKEDWAVYRLPFDLYSQGQLYTQGLLPINTEDRIPYAYADTNSNQDGKTIMIVGYSSLKIMSDEKIEEFKQRYINYLKQQGITDMSYQNTGITSDGGINTKHDDRVATFTRRLDYNYWQEDSKLKVSSDCSFANTYRSCQGWGGTSGGGVFVVENKRLTGVVTRGFSVIGGSEHAHIVDQIPTERIFKEKYIKFQKPYPARVE